jgi:hypothetical protein
MGLSRPDKSRGKPSSLLKNDDDYRSVFNPSIDLEIYFWTAKTQRQIDTFIVSEIANASVPQKSNLRYHLSMLVAEKLYGGALRSPHQLKRLALDDAAMSTEQVSELFENLKQWSDKYLKTHGVILERATKAQRFSEYLLSCAQRARAAE